MYIAKCEIKDFVTRLCCFFQNFYKEIEREEMYIRFVNMTGDKLPDTGAVIGGIKFILSSHLGAGGEE